MVAKAYQIPLFSPKGVVEIRQVPSFHSPFNNLLFDPFYLTNKRQGTHNIIRIKKFLKPTGFVHAINRNSITIYNLRFSREPRCSLNDFPSHSSRVRRVLKVVYPFQRSDLDKEELKGKVIQIETRFIRTYWVYTRLCIALCDNIG